MEYTSTIKSIFKKESFNTKDGALMHKYVVEFVNGHNPNVFTTKANAEKHQHILKPKR
jgi:hypothetical protein